MSYNTLSLPIDHGCPINWNSEFASGAGSTLLRCYLAIPGYGGGARFVDLCDPGQQRFALPLANMSTVPGATSGWYPATEFGGSSPYAGVNPAIGKMLKFNGSTSHCTLTGGDAGLPSGKSGMGSGCTMGFYGMSPSNPGGTATGLAYGTSGNERSIGISDTNTWFFFDGGGTIRTTTPLYNTPQFLSVSFNPIAGIGARVFINGGFLTSGGADGNSTTLGSIQIGSRFGSGLWNGTIAFAFIASGYWSDEKHARFWAKEVRNLSFPTLLRRVRGPLGAAAAAATRQQTLTMLGLGV